MKRFAFILFAYFLACAQDWSRRSGTSLCPRGFDYDRNGRPETCGGFVGEQCPPTSYCRYLPRSDYGYCCLRSSGKSYFYINSIYCEPLPLNPFTSSGLSYHNSLNRSISNSRVPGQFLVLLYFYRNSCINCKQCRPWSDVEWTLLPQLFEKVYFQ